MIKNLNIDLENLILDCDIILRSNTIIHKIVWQTKKK